MKKLFLIALTLVVALGMAFIDDDGKAKDETETSYKTGKPVPRYLSEFRRVAITVPPDYSGDVPGIRSKELMVIETLNEAVQAAMQFDWYSKILYEHILFTVSDLGNARFTVKLGEGDPVIKAGVDSTEKPTIVVPLATENLKNLANILSDGVMTYEEQYRVFYFITVPALQAIYQKDVLYAPGDKSAFRYDDFMQVILPPEEEVLYKGLPIKIEATIVNVDGQWMVFKGLQGDPDLRVAPTLDQAARLYELAAYEVSRIGSRKEAMEVSGKFLSLLDSITVYNRHDHLDK